MDMSGCCQIKYIHLHVKCNRPSQPVTPLALLALNYPRGALQTEAGTNGLLYTISIRKKSEAITPIM